MHKLIGMRLLLLLTVCSAAEGLFASHTLLQGASMESAKTLLLLQNQAFLYLGFGRAIASHISFHMGPETNVQETMLSYLSTVRNLDRKARELTAWDL